MAGEGKSKMLPAVTLEDLFAMPLLALIDADAYAAQSAYRFIREFGFERSPDAPPDDLGTLRTITFTYQRTAPGGAPEIMSVTLPVLALIPLPLLTIKQAQLDFGIDVIGVESEDEVQTGSQALTSATAMSQLERSRRPAPPRLRGRLSRPAGSARGRIEPGSLTELGSMNVHMRVKVDVDQADMPEGIQQLLNLATEAVRAETTIMPTLGFHLRGDQFRFSRVGERVEARASLRTASGDPISGVTIGLSQDAAGLFTIPKEIVTGSDGDSRFDVVLARMPPEVRSFRLIVGSTQVEAGDFGLVEVMGELQVEIVRKVRTDT